MGRVRKESIEEERGDKRGKEERRKGGRGGKYRGLLVHLSIMVIISNIYVYQDITPHVLMKCFFANYSSINLLEALFNRLYKMLLKNRTIEDLS